MPGLVRNNKSLINPGRSGLRFCLALLAGLGAFFPHTSLSQNSAPRYEKANQTSARSASIRNDHDLPASIFLQDPDTIPFRAGFRMAAPKTAFRLTGGLKQYRRNSAIISDCLCNLSLAGEVLEPMSVKTTSETTIYLRYTKSDSIANTLNCKLKARSNRHLQRQWVNYLLGNFMLGTGPENVLFPPETTASQAIKKSRLMRKTLKAYLADRKDTLYDPYAFRAHFGPVETILITAHPTGIEHFTGSFEGAIVRTSDSTWHMTVVNITSVTSADLYSAFFKPSSWMKSFPRSSIPHPYGNIMQVYQLSFTATELRKLARV